ncbi:hypothetical protein C7S20_00375 [Christiangramia fulva]|uniref:Exostosin GT47 domain-containing protein n=1 Tax=Christiangramia fulva TaxID=2126553 RepID=A0A2R3Z0R4_9FLAO|nr:exostosin family protein [Christiangramia fulva]AVR43849.1 hypothetical protein C7S20_00375 [Christiangramia fulva]
MVNVTDVSLIQEIRAVQALSELNFEINISQEEQDKFRLLKYYFNMPYSVGLKEGVDIKNIIKIDHSQPITSIFLINKTLVFPKAIITHLKLKWAKKRKYKILFAGLIDAKREEAIEKWLFANYHRSYRIKHVTFGFKIKRKLFTMFNIEKPLLKKFGELFISRSNRGRIFPVKSWDKEYYNLLLKSKFILCPSGVYIWTYRFFESILCGAIPIVEEPSPAYEGFKFYTMEENLSNLEWKKEIVEYNYKLCLERITLSDSEAIYIQNKIQSLNNNCLKQE